MCQCIIRSTHSQLQTLQLHGNGISMACMRDYDCMIAHNYTMQVHLVDGSLQVLLNSVDITDTINDTNTSGIDMTPRPVSFQRISESSIRTHFSSGVSITVSLSFGMLNFVGALPQNLRGLPIGLLGNFNGDTSDDLTYPNGTVLDMNSPDSFIHEFGQSCE